MDTTFWRAMSAAKYAVPDGYTVSDLTSELIGYLGSTDPELRDEFAHDILAHWVLNGVYSPADLRAMIGPMADNLTHGIGETGTDSVFLRAFSVLMLAAYVYYDNHKQPYLTEPEVQRLLEQTLTYFSAERDLRGHVPGKGWAHSCAHTADLLDEFALNRYMTAADLERLLNAFADKVAAPTGFIYLYNEDDRMSFAALSAIKRGLLTPDQVAAWINRLAQVVERHERRVIFTDPGAHSAYHNTKNFLRSLAIRLADEDLPAEVRSLAANAHAALKKF
jgi:hypothetical protein